VSSEKGCETCKSRERYDYSKTLRLWLCLRCLRRVEKTKELVLSITTTNERRALARAVHAAIEPLVGTGHSIEAQELFEAHFQREAKRDAKGDLGRLIGAVSRILKETSQFRIIMEYDNNARAIEDARGELCEAFEAWIGYSDPPFVPLSMWQIWEAAKPFHGTTCKKFCEWCKRAPIWSVLLPFGYEPHDRTEYAIKARERMNWTALDYNTHTGGYGKYT
jgi:hypothetical protein